jgi:5S rRNA maturation endonuclease (ribonuclease M5)
MSFPEEDFFEFIEKLQSEKDAVIIVEGINDKKALEFWDIALPIETLKHPWFEFIEMITEKFSKKHKIILLLDADPQGRKYHTKLKDEFRKYGFKVSSGYWLKIQRYHITCIEGLSSPQFQELRLRYLSLKIDDLDRKDNPI